MHARMHLACVLSDHGAVKLEISNKRNSRNHKNTLSLNTVFNKQIIQEAIAEIKKFIETNDSKNVPYQKL